MSGSPTFLQSYYLRSYSREIGRPRRRLSFTPKGEAIFQTALLIFIALLGLVSLVGSVLLHTQETHLLMLKYRDPITVSVVLATLGVAFAIGSRVSKGVQDPEQRASQFASTRQQAIGHAQFFSVLVLTLAVPWAVAWFYGDV